MRWLGMLIASAVLVLAGCDSSSRGGPVAEDRAEALRPKAAEITDLLAKNDWAAVRKDFDPVMEDALSEAQLAEAWAQATGPKGAYVSRGEPVDGPKAPGVVAFDTPMKFANGDMKSRVALRENGQIAGLFILVPDAP